MKKKKGFTLIEIIICIGMLAIIAVGSIVGINLVNKNLTLKELNQITNKAIQAAQVYIETNKEAQNQLYTEQNAVKIPIKVLVNEGLLSLKGTKLDNSKIKNEYVITALSTESGNSTECTNIDSKASWDNDKVIYICTNLNSKGEVTGSNLATIDPTKYNNRTKVSSEPYYFKGYTARNYVKYNDTLFRIYFVDTDDTLVLYNQNSFGDTFKNETKSITSYNAANSVTFYKKYYPVYCQDNLDEKRIARNGKISSSTVFEGETDITSVDVINTSYCTDDRTDINSTNSSTEAFLDTWMNFDAHIAVATKTGTNTYIKPSGGYKIHLNNSFKLGSGTGDYSNPYILEKK